MRRVIIFVAAVMLLVSCATASYKLYVEYEMENGTKFACKTKVVQQDKSAVAREKCMFKIVYGNNVYSCAVDLDKLQKGYRPSIDVDCSAIIK